MFVPEKTESHQTTEALLAQLEPHLLHYDPLDNHIYNMSKKIANQKHRNQASPHLKRNQPEKLLQRSTNTADKDGHFKKSVNKHIETSKLVNYSAFVRFPLLQGCVFHIVKFLTVCIVVHFEVLVRFFAFSIHV